MWNAVEEQEPQSNEKSGIIVVEGQVELALAQKQWPAEEVHLKHLKALQMWTA